MAIDWTKTIATYMGILIMVGQLFLSLSILIVLHELGHFLPARLFGTRVEKFYLFFDAWGGSLFKFTKGETEYGIGWLPLGGYVKISGMIDESFDKEQMAGEPQEWEFRSKTAWQRLIIMLGGVTVNFLLGFLIYAMVLFTWGNEYLPNANVTHGIYVDSLGQEMGLREGDKILAIGDQPFEKFNSRLLTRAIIIDGVASVTVERNQQELTLPIDEKFTTLLASYKYKDYDLFGPRFPFIIRRVAADSPAEKAGIQPEDQLLSLNGQSTPFAIDFVRAIADYPNETVQVGVLRNGTDTLQLQLTTSEEAKIGIGTYTPFEILGSETQEYSLAEAFPAGYRKGVNFLNDQLKAFGQMFRGNIKVQDSLGGFGTIAGMYGTEWIWERFWEMTAILSLILAFMNLLPIPALDGGHVMFLLYEVVTGKKPSDKFMEIATIVGFVIVIGLVLYANGLDLFRSIFG